jgi:Xaa-Pro dipeptidase
VYEETSVYVDRVQRLFRAAPKGVNVIVISFPNAVRYLTGSHEGMAVMRRNRVELLTHRMGEESARESGLPVRVWTRDAIDRIYAAAFRGAGKVGYLEGQTTVPAQKDLRKRCGRRPLVDVSPQLYEIAAIKDKDEIRLLRRACKIASDTADRVPGMLKEGMTELDLVREILYCLAQLGGEGTSFPCIVGFGANTSHPHAVPARRKLSKGQLVMVDFGATVAGYGSDITRTLCFGKASKKQRDLYTACHDAHLLSFDMIRKGKNGGDINKAVSEFFVSRGYPEFIHSIGHGLGLLGGGFVNKPGAVNTVEPGIYLPGYGGVRIEDDILIKDHHSFELLTKSPRDRLIEV